MKLHMFLYDELTASLETGAGQLTTADAINWTNTSARLSAAWDDVPSPDALFHWLDACLPENGSREPYKDRAQALRLEYGQSARIAEPVDVLWGNTDAEYAGAVRFRREDEYENSDTASGYTRLSDKEIGERLYEAWRVANGSGKGPERNYTERRSSLSGMRGKIGLTQTAEGSWVAARGAYLNTWIAKREDDRRLPGEAGVESICQRTLALLAIPAARTLSRVFAGEQSVLSERSDRYIEAGSEKVRPRHQEEFCQACAWPAGLKYESGLKSEPRWEQAYAILARHSRDPTSSQALLTRILAASWAIGHTDLHRRNLGFSHALPKVNSGVTVAPMYDVSSGVGIEKTVSFRMAIGIARQREFQGIGPAQWLEHAKTTGQGRGSVLAIVSETLANLSSALAEARDQARTGDENRDQRSVDRRIEAMFVYVDKRRKAWESTLGRMRTKGASGLDGQANSHTQNQPSALKSGTTPGDDADAQRAARIHGVRSRHADPKVRADAAMHLAAVTPREKALRNLETMLRDDADVRADAELAARVDARRIEVAGGMLSGSAAADAVTAAHSEQGRSEAREAVRPPKTRADAQVHGLSGVTRRSREGAKRDSGPGER